MPEPMTILNCFDNNDDGAGFMYRQADGKVRIEKGFMSYRKLMDAIEEIPYDLKTIDLAMHFRLATQGSVCAENCHPFPISSARKDLRATSITSHAGLVHNGIIHFCDKAKVKGKDHKDMSDTQIFIKNVLSQLPIKQLRNQAMAELILEATSSKFMIMTRDDNLLIGGFIEDNGVYYSNRTYKDLLYRGSKFSCYSDFDWVKDYDDYEYERRAITVLDEDMDCDHECDICRSLHCMDDVGAQWAYDNYEDLWDGKRPLCFGADRFPLDYEIECSDPLDEVCDDRSCLPATTGGQVIKLKERLAMKERLAAL